MDISRELAIRILKFLDENRDFYFPFLIMNKEYTEEDDDFVEIEPDEWETIEVDENYKTFQLWENLKNLDLLTLNLLSKGFIEMITIKSVRSDISELVKNYREAWKVESWESDDIEGYGFNEFIRGKAEAYEDCLRIMRDCSK